MAACGPQDSIKRISNTLGVDLSKGNVVQDINSHGGFLGDGITFKEITFTDNGQVITDKIKSNDGWCELPLTENLRKAVYGRVQKPYVLGQLVSNDEGEPLFPLIENGYYFFYDRNSESKDSKDDTDLYNRNSYNFTIAIYDTDRHILYYFELDT